MTKPAPVSRRDFLRLAAFGSAALAGGSGLVRLARAQTKAPARKLGIALLGLGDYSLKQLRPALMQHTNLCRLAGLVSGHPEKAALWAQELGLPARNVYSYENFDRIADNPDIDIVYVVTPPGTHAEYVIRAAKARKHVICEKPLAGTVEDCDAMIAACRAAKVRFSVGYRLHFDPYHQEMMRLAGSGELGPFTKMSGELGWPITKWMWRIDKKLGGGGPMMDVGIYVVHGACMAQGGIAPIAVTAQEDLKVNPELFNEVEEGMRWTMEFPNGAKLDGYSTYDRNTARFWLESPRGWIDFPKNPFAYRGIIGTTSRGPMNFPIVNQQARQMDDFADCILTGRATVASGEMGRRDIRILQAIYEAARTGKRVLV